MQRPLHLIGTLFLVFTSRACMAERAEVSVSWRLGQVFLFKTPVRDEVFNVFT